MTDRAGAPRGGRLAVVPGRRPKVAALAAATLLAAGVGGVAGCAAGADRAAAPSGPVATPGAGAGRADTPGAGSAAAGPERVRDGDVTDVDELARAMAASAVGDRDWIAVVAELRSRSWLTSRYPGRYDLDQIYADEAAEAAQANEAEQLSLDLYLDEPLPALLSVEEAGALGPLVELEVLLEAGPATVRRELDDRPEGVLPGGRHRGLFVVGRDSTGSWRIHSITELQATG